VLPGRLELARRPCSSRRRFCRFNVIAASSAAASMQSALVCERYP
jgi:hypothetical protein